MRLQESSSRDQAGTDQCLETGGMTLYARGRLKCYLVAEVILE